MLRIARFLLVVLPALALLALAVSPSPAQQTDRPSITMPWEGGTVWRYMNGPHTASGDVDDALDFQPPDAAGQTCEAFTSAFWAVAAAKGRATVMANAVELDHGNGFRSGYYHLADKQVKSGDTVEAGQRLGHPGCCPDGGAGENCAASEPHLHFYTSGANGRQPIGGQHIGGWLVDLDGCLVRPDRRACRGASLTSNAPRFEGVAGSSVAATVAIDTSASMDGEVASGDVLRLVSPYLRAAVEGQPVTLITFDSRSRVVPVKEGSDAAFLTAPARGSSSQDVTDLRAGLSRACSEMKLRGPEVKQFLVLITDGFHNAGRLQDPARCLRERGWRVFAISPGRANGGLLGQIASETGGEYRPAPSIFDPACYLQRLRAITAGIEETACSHFLLMPGDRLSLPLAVPPEQAQASVILTSATVGGPDSGHKMSLVLRLPNGEALADQDTLARESDGRTERYAVARPVAGVWEAVVSGRGLPVAGVLVDLSFVTTPLVYAYGGVPDDTPGPSATPVIVGELATPVPEAVGTPTSTPTPTPTRRPRLTVAPTGTSTAAASTPTLTPTPAPSR